MAKHLNIKYLLIEDEHFTVLELTSMVNLLRPTWECINIAHDSIDATEMLSQNNFNLIISDISLPDGLSIDILKKQNINTPIMFITGYESYRPLTKQFNTVRFLIKPISLEALKAAIEDFESYYINFNLKKV